MKLLERLTWATVELSAQKPQIDLVRKALEEALESAMMLQAANEIRQNNFVRLAKVNGGM